MNSQLRFLLFTTMILALLSAPASGTTILVRSDGTGDQPTIQTAVMASVAGDTIILADGTFSGAGNRAISIAGKHLYILSESDDHYFGINGNISVSPMFCAAYNPSDPWTLDSNSPAFTASCGTMGAKDYAGCGVVGTDERSWGDIKRMHR